MLKRIALAVCMGLFVAGAVAGCGQKEETPGQKLDKGLNQLKEAGKEAKDKLEDAGEAVKEKVKDATE